MKLYSCSAVDGLIQRYIDVGGTAYEIEEGTLGYGLTVCIANGYKCAVITEVYLNEWSSGHKVRFYNALPQKYANRIENAVQYETWGLHPTYQ